MYGIWYSICQQSGYFSPSRGVPPGAQVQIWFCFSRQRRRLVLGTVPPHLCIKKNQGVTERYFYVGCADLCVLYEL